jgi:hypothetical protein
MGCLYNAGSLLFLGLAVLAFMQGQVHAAIPFFIACAYLGYKGEVCGRRESGKREQ